MSMADVSSESIKGREYLDQLYIFLLLKEYSILMKRRGG
jgi:hypothetical protein